MCRRFGLVHCCVGLNHSALRLLDVSNGYVAVLTILYSNIVLIVLRELAIVGYDYIHFVSNSIKFSVQFSYFYHLLNYSIFMFEVLDVIC